LGFLGQFVEKGLRADGVLVVDGGERVTHVIGGLGLDDDGAVSPDGRFDDQGEREGVAWPRACTRRAVRSDASGRAS
jgi:hypothetical protein